jgi:hypothetical protein
VATEARICERNYATGGRRRSSEPTGVAVRTNTYIIMHILRLPQVPESVARLLRMQMHGCGCAAMRQAQRGTPAALGGQKGGAGELAAGGGDGGSRTSSHAVGSGRFILDRRPVSVALGIHVRRQASLSRSGAACARFALASLIPRWDPGDG